MVRRVGLSLVFAVALAAVGLGLSTTAEARHGCYGPGGGYGGGGYGGGGYGGGGYGGGGYGGGGYGGGGYGGGGYRGGGYGGGGYGGGGYGGGGYGGGGYGGHYRAAYVPYGGYGYVPPARSYFGPRYPYPPAWGVGNHQPRSGVSFSIRF